MPRVEMTPVEAAAHFYPDVDPAKALRSMYRAKRFRKLHRKVGRKLYLMVELPDAPAVDPALTTARREVARLKVASGSIPEPVLCHADGRRVTSSTNCFRPSSPHPRRPNPRPLRKDAGPDCPTLRPRWFSPAECGSAPPES